MGRSKGVDEGELAGRMSGLSGRSFGKTKREKESEKQKERERGEN